MSIDFCPSCNAKTEMRYDTKVIDEMNYDSFHYHSQKTIFISTCSICGEKYIAANRKNYDRKLSKYILNNIIYLIIAAVIFIIDIVAQKYFDINYIGVILLIIYLLIVVSVFLFRHNQCHNLTPHVKFDSSFNPVIPKPNAYIELAYIANNSLKEFNDLQVYKLIINSKELFILITDIKCEEKVNLYFCSSLIDVNLIGEKADIYRYDNKYIGFGIIREY